MAQADQERYLIPWAQDHASDPDSPIEFMPPDPNKPWQSADVFVSPARPLSKLPEKVILLGLRIKLAKTLGGGALTLASWNQAGRMASDFKKTPAFADRPDGPSVAEQIEIDIASGRNLAVPCPHNILEDIGIAAGGVLLATGRLDYIKDVNYIPLNPAMKYEGFNGKDLDQFISPVGSRVWVIPFTPSASQREIPRQLRAWYSRGVNQTMGPRLNKPSRGTITYVAPTASRMIPTKDEAGKVIGWEIPLLYSQAAAALSYADRALPFALYRNPETMALSWEVGSFISRNEIPGSSETKKNEHFLDEVMLDLSERMRRLSKLPIKYSRLINGTDSEV